MQNATDRWMETKPLHVFKPPEPGWTVPPCPILVGYRGSIAHNMYVPSEDPNSIDDIDLMSFHFGPRSHYLGLQGWGSRGTKESKQGQYDIVSYELRKAVTLLLQGNPNIVSMLWLRDEHCLVTSPASLVLRSARQHFVGKHVYKSFAGYAAAQMAKMESRDPAELREYLGITAELKRRGIHPNHKNEIIAPPEDHPAIYADWSPAKLTQRLAKYLKKGENIGYMGDKRKRLVLEHGFDAKNAAHLIRLLRMCVEFLKTGEMQVWRPDAEELLSIKRGEWTLEAVKEHAEGLFDAAKRARDRSTLPEEPDRGKVELLMMDLIEDYLKIAPG